MNASSRSSHAGTDVIAFHAARRFRCALGISLAIPLSLLAVSCVTVPETSVARPGIPETSPHLAPSEGRTLKRKVVVARFTNETMYGKSVLLGDKDLLAKQASDVLSTQLASSGKFLLFERSDSARILEALDSGKIGDFGLPADFLIIGSVSEFGREETSRTGLFSRTRMQKAHARVNVRLVNTRTSEVIFSEEGAGEALSEVGTVVGIGTKAGYDSTLNDKAISAAISKVVNNLLENLLDQPWRSYVLAAENGVVTIGGGASQGIAPGDRFSLVRKGKLVTNPQTNMPIELPGETVATLEVVSVFGRTPRDEISRCRVVSGTFPEADFADYRVEEVTP